MSSATSAVRPVSAPRVICTLDIGGTNAKAKCAHWPEKRATPSGKGYTPEQLARDLPELLAGEKVDAITIGLPAPLRDGRPLKDPVNLGPGWKDFDYRAAFGVPVKILNDAAMQAIGSYGAAGLTKGSMLFLGLGTGLGTCMIADHRVLPMELAHLPYRKGRSFEDYVGIRGKKRFGRRRWREHVEECVRLLRAALLPDVIVLGGGNSRDLARIPEGCVLGENSNAFLGGYAVWQPEWAGAATEL
ncbi:MAG: ROK family protein [Phycisphaerales bacterium]